jgi:hypothetical protein
MAAYRKGLEAGRAEALAGIESRLERLESLVQASLCHADLGPDFETCSVVPGKVYFLKGDE